MQEVGTPLMNKVAMITRKMALLGSNMGSMRWVIQFGFSVSQKYLPGLSTPRRARAACLGCPRRTVRSRRCRSTTRSPATSAGSTLTGAGPGPGAAAASAQVRRIELETKIREDFTIIEKVPARALSLLKVHTTGWTKKNWDLKSMYIALRAIKIKQIKF